MDNKEFVNDVLMEAISFLNNEQITKLKNILLNKLYSKTITEKETRIVPHDYVSMNEEIIKKFALSLAITNRSEGTIRQYVREARKFFEVVNKPYSLVEKDDALYFMSTLFKDKKTAKCINNYLMYLKQFFGWLYDNEYIERNPFKKIQRLKEESKLKYVMPRREVETMKDCCCNIQERAIIDLLASCGLRVSEISNIKINDTDFESGKIKIYAKKTKKERIAYLSDEALNHLIKYRNSLSEEQLECEKLFVSTRKYKGKYKGLNSSSFNRIVKKVKHAAKYDEKDITVHTFRRAFATNLLEKGCSESSITYVMGHASFDTTMNSYLKFNNSKIEHEVRKCLI